METLNAWVAEAVRHHLGEDYVSQYYSSRNQVCPARGRERGADLEVFFANQVFKHHIRAMHETNQPSDTPLRVIVKTPYGLVKHEEYATTSTLAAALVEHMSEAMQPLVADIRHDNRGMIKITTKMHLEWHTVMGRFPCSLCGLYFNGTKGLRVHREIQHNHSYVQARDDAVAASNVQIIAYTAPRTMLHQWTESAKAAERRRRDLEPGLDAARRGDIPALQALLHQGWDAKSTRDVHGNDAMLWAAIEGHLGMCRFLHEQVGLDAAALQGKLGRNALHWAARNGFRRICEWLINEVKIDVDCATLDGTTPLHYAVYGQHLDIVQWLVDIGCDIHCLNVFGCNASQWCAMTGNVDILRFLVEKGLDCSVLNRNGHSALHKAALKGHDDMCMWLVRPVSEGGGGLHRRHMQPDDEGFTPMMFASANGHTQLGHHLQAMHDALTAPEA
ncbi:hypothetical protein H310_01065 [Aphanomyces invadans]|uniref:C2H2-type domain-containing protein n=1 Tax=Aphanomyces invadans TaxID=157072 RepID=A0A024UQE2_9STRA|nr:hypothetical protein H310_01065 [Aphanomyces invadans]ETW08499.1 hypothetical protein H310_01065 [Aphanomyces invadans]|eukprot:XP_008862304.1 hypothetical protein H310_01065 [Aphanomyces invadans]